MNVDKRGSVEVVGELTWFWGQHMTWWPAYMADDFLISFLAQCGATVFPMCQCVLGCRVPSHVRVRMVLQSAIGQMDSWFVNFLQWWWSFFNHCRGRVVLRARTCPWEIGLEPASPALQNLWEHIIPQKNSFYLKQFK